MRMSWKGGALGAALLSLCACSAGGSGAGGMGAPPPTQPPSRGLAGAFDHVIVVVQENRTVDNLFNGFPGADTVRSGLRGNATVQLVPVPLQPSSGEDHSHAGFVADYDGGRMNGFDHPHHQSSTAYAYVRASDVVNYWSLAKRFTLADEVFQMNMGPSFAAHVNLVAAQGGYPFAFADNPHGSGAPGCLGNETLDTVDMRTPFPGALSSGPACTNVPTIFDLLDRGGVSWRYYAPASGIGITYWSAPDYIRHIALGADHANLVSPETRILNDIASDTLPAVSYVVPQACASDHPHDGGHDPLAGPRWVAAITNAVGQSRAWDRTLVLVTWDDWGGWYDHVPPSILSADQLGFRVPLLIVSAHPGNAGAVDHRVRSQAAILHAIEDVFGVGSLHQLDAETDDLASDFRFDRTVPYGPPLPAQPPPHGDACKLNGID